MGVPMRSFGNAHKVSGYAHGITWECPLSHGQTHTYMGMPTNFVVIYVDPRVAHVLCRMNNQSSQH
jgi:hypothetical protein